MVDKRKRKPDPVLRARLRKLPLAEKDIDAVEELLVSLEEEAGRLGLEYKERTERPAWSLMKALAPDPGERPSLVDIILGE